MEVRVYAIIGPDLYFGCATDRTTLLSLIELAKVKGAVGVSLHGKLNDDTTLSGEMSLNQAFDLVLDADEKVVYEHRFFRQVAKVTAQTPKR